MQKNKKKDQLSDLIDSDKDKREMKTEISSINLPDTNDIPGQKNFTAESVGETGDTTASSADEEGDEVFDDDIDETLEENADSNVSDAERKDLEIAANDMPGDDENLREAALDDTDDDGMPLNEGSFGKKLSASDLDIPGADLDDEDEDIGEEDEENNDYSAGGDNDDIPEDDF